MSKDAPIFIRGPTKGEVRFPPVEDPDDIIAAEHRRFSIFPAKRISDFPRHIPYNSEKKSFLEKTGRGAFEGM
jgi:hypothetical protein